MNEAQMLTLISAAKYYARKRREEDWQSDSESEAARKIREWNEQREIQKKRSKK